MSVDRAQWERELASHDELFAKLGDKRPPALASGAPAHWRAADAVDEQCVATRGKGRFARPFFLAC